MYDNFILSYIFEYYIKKALFCKIKFILCKWLVVFDLLITKYIV